MKLRNLTSHEINIVPYGVVLPHENRPVKVTQHNKQVGVTEEGVPIYEVVYDDISGLPEYEEGIMNIVSAPVLNYVVAKMPHRKDFCSPFKAIKNQYGKTVGCGGLRVNG